MEIDISGRHFHVGEALKDHIIEKVQRMDRYPLKLEMVHVILEVQKFVHTAEITALGKRLRLTAKEKSTDMYAAFDKSFENMKLQLQRQHERLKDHKARRYSAGRGLAK